MTEKLDISIIRTAVSQFENDPTNVMISNACQINDINSLVINNRSVDKFNHIFSNTLPDNDAIDQGQAGVCWICGGITMCRKSIIKKMGLDKSFNLSINYLLFWDKIEKCNYFMDHIIKNHDKQFDSKIMRDILSSPCSDGGFWHTFADLIEKYGIVPDTVCKRKYSSRHTSNMNMLLKHKLREFAAKIMSPNKNSTHMSTQMSTQMSTNMSTNMSTHMSIEQMMEIKNEYTVLITKIMMNTIGTPIFPDTVFDWTYEIKNKKHVVKNLTPMSFYEKYCNLKFNDFTVIINDPRPRHPYNKLYVTSSVNHMSADRSDMTSHLLLNLHYDDIAQLIMKQIDDGIPVWFACDIGKYTNHKRNIMDIDVYNYGIPFNTSFTQMSKADRMDFSDSWPTHAMAIVGYDIDENHNNEEDIDNIDNINNISNKKRHNENIITCVSKKLKGTKKSKRDANYYSELSHKIVKFKVENSWGNYGDNNGYYVMTHKWFKMFGYEYTIHTKYLNDQQKKILTTTPIKLKQHDVFGFDVL